MITSNKIKILSVILLFLTGIILFIISLRGEPVSQTAPEPIYEDTPAVFSGNYSDLINNTSVTAFNLLRDDVKTLGVKSFEEYKNLEKEVIFHVSETVMGSVANQNEITVTGYFEVREEGIVTIYVDLLPNERINVTFDQSLTAFDINELPSNSERNKFIATLPEQKPGYDIEYDLDTDTFILRLYDLEAQESAVDYIYASINDPQYREKIEIIPLGSTNFERFESIYPNNGAEVVTD